MSKIQKSAVIQQSEADASVTVVAPGAGKYNCLTHVSVTSSAAGDLTITSGSKDVYTIAIAAGGGATLDFAEDVPWIGAENSTIVIAQAGGGTVRINARGFVTP